MFLAKIDYIIENSDSKLSFNNFNKSRSYFYYIFNA